jgi:hypothetical protein
MDLEILRRKISTYCTEGGYIKNVSDELLMEILHAWENWTGSSSAFYDALNVDFRKMASLIGKAKKMKREGHFAAETFKEVAVEQPSAPLMPSQELISLQWDQERYYEKEIVLTQAEFSLFFEGANLEKRFVESPTSIKKYSH